MSQPPQNWGPGPLGPPPGPGPNPPPPGPSSSPGAYGPGAYGPGAYGPGQGGPAYAPQRPPGKKSKLPLVLGIVGGVLVLLVGGVVFALMLFRAPTLPINRTIMIFEAPGVQVGPVALVRAKTATTTFGSSDACAKKLTAATSGSDSIVTAEVKSGPSAITARTSTAQETDRVYDALAGEMKDCRAPRYSVTSKGIDAGVANGVSYQRFVVEQTSGSSPRMTDLQLMKYGNTWSVVLSPQGSVSDPAAIARSYAERVRAAAK